MALLYGYGSAGLRLQSHYEEALYELALEAPSGFEHGTSGLGIQHLIH